MRICRIKFHRGVEFKFASEGWKNFEKNFEKCVDFFIDLRYTITVASETDNLTETKQNMAE